MKTIEKRFLKSVVRAGAKARRKLEPGKREPEKVRA